MVFVVAFLAFATVASAQVVKTCRAAGDPHYTTWNGVRHDVQIAGEQVLFRHNETDTHVHITTDRCGHCRTDRPGVYCIRDFTVKHAWSSYSISVKWGRWPGNQHRCSNTGAGTIDEVLIQRTFPAERGTDADTLALVALGCTENTLVANTYSCDPNKLKTFTFSTTGPYRGVKITTHNNLVRVDTVSVEDGPQWGKHSVSFKQFSIVVQAERGLFDGSEGLCGYNSDNAANDFVAVMNDTLFNYSPGTVRGTRRNTAPVYNWGGTFMLQSSTDRLLDVSHHPSGIYQLSNFVVTDLPNASDIVQLDQADFTSQAVMTAAQKTCTEALAGIEDEDGGIFQNCMFDQAVTDGDVTGSEMAASIADANTPDAEDSDNGVAAGTVAAIVVGATLVVAMVAVALLSIRLKRTRKDLSRALVLVSGESTIPASSQENIRLSDNL